MHRPQRRKCLASGLPARTLMRPLSMRIRWNSAVVESDACPQTRQELGEDPTSWKQARCPSGGDERVGQGQAIRPLPSDSRSSGFRDRLCRHGDLACRNFLRRWSVPPRLVGEVKMERSVSALHANPGRVRTERLRWIGGTNDVAGHVVGQLDDHLGEWSRERECPVPSGVSWVAMDLTLTICRHP